VFVVVVDVVVVVIVTWHSTNPVIARCSIIITVTIHYYYCRRCYRRVTFRPQLSFTSIQVVVSFVIVVSAISGCWLYCYCCY